jgi:hypothetical protein
MITTTHMYMTNKCLTEGENAPMPTSITWTTGLRVFQDDTSEHFIDGTAVLTSKPDASGRPILYIVNFLPRNPSLLNI